MQTSQSLELRQQQQLALTPQLQQSIRLLQLSTLELEQEVAQALLDNPLLERIDSEQYGTESADQAPANLASESSALGFTNSAPDDDNDWFPEASESPSLARYLKEQLIMSRFQPYERVLLELLIDELDDNGYLQCELSDFLAYLPEEAGLDLDDIKSAYQHLLQLEPAGVGASSLEHCLRLQLDRERHRLSPSLARNAQATIARHLHLLATGSVQRLADALGVSFVQAQEVYGLLLRFNPRPGAPWADNVADYVVPDVFLKRVGNQWIASVNSRIVPKLKLVQLDGWTSQTHPELAQQHQAAQALIRSLHNRHITIVRVAQAIVDHQRSYFEYGPAAMRPLLLRDIAEPLALHESTVSRATRQKYMQTPMGMIELRSLFGEGLPNEDGSSIAPSAVQARIGELIAQEPSLKPLSDNALATLLAKDGITVARRTVAKYRDLLGIEAASQRKARALAVRR